MAIIITDECINCGACEVECPNTAIYEGGIENQDQDPVSYDFYYIVTDKCTECIGFHEEPQCAAVCPVECCVPDEDNVETEKDLLTKKAFLHCE